LLSFAIVGDTRGPIADDVSAYPTSVITKIWQDVEAFSPRPPFAITTGNYSFASLLHMPGTQAAQLDLYLCARASFRNVLFPAMGDQECSGTTADNCGAGTPLGNSPNYNAFVEKLLAPINQPLPYYAVRIDGENNAWSAKFVFVACNYWSQIQATWLSEQLAIPTTYTFVVRHEGSAETSAPCMSGSPSAATIMAQYPLTLLITGEPNTFAYLPATKELVVGNGGAPLNGAGDYGYVIATQQSNGVIRFNALDYSTGADLAGSPFTVSP
jgi:hypothetical protein